MDQIYLRSLSAGHASRAADSPPYEDNQFQWYDWLLFCVTLAISLGIGIYQAFGGDKQRTTSEYLMGNRSMGTVPVALSMFMSYISAILVLGNTAEMYLHGITLWLSVIGSSLAMLLSGLLFVPIFYRLNITSSFEYLEMRFKSRAAKLTGSILLIVSQVMYMGIAMYAPATALDSVTPIPPWASVVAVGIIGTVYTTVGGIKAVIWTDTFQSVVLFGGVITVLILGTIEVGGFGEVFYYVDEGGRNEINTSVDPTARVTLWSVIIAYTVQSLFTTGFMQTSVQRFCTLPTLNKAVVSTWLNIPLYIVAYSLTCLVGLVVFAYYWSSGCDPLRSGEIDNSNQLLPYFIVDVLKVPGLPGLFVAVLFSGALSSVSSSMNSLSAVTWKDLMERKFYYLPESKKAFITKTLSGLYGLLGIGFAFFVATLGSHVMQIAQSFLGGVNGPILGLFLLGMLFPWANWKGALFGTWFGFALNMTILLGNSIQNVHSGQLNTTVYACNGTVLPLPEAPEDTFPLFRLSFVWYSTLGTVTTIILGLLVSFITGPEKASDQNPALMVPLFDKLFCCFTKNCLNFLHCKVDYDSLKTDETGHLIVEPEDKDDGAEDKENEPYEKTDLGYIIEVKGSSENSINKSDVNVTDSSDIESQENGSGHINLAYQDTDESLSTKL